MDRIEMTHWWFIAKRRFLQHALDRFHLSAPVRALDVGCGTGAVMAYLQKNGYTVDGLDMSPIAQSICQEKGLSPVIGDATSLSFADSTFDLVTALDVVEHVEDDTAAYAEMVRVVKPGGLIIISVPAHQWLWSYHDVALHHVRRYSKRSLQQLVNVEGVDVTVTPIHMFILPLVAVVRFLNRSQKREAGESDVALSRPFVNGCMALVYRVELALLSFFGRLPWGTSFLVVAKKKVTL